MGKSTVTVQIESVVDEEWIDFVVGNVDIFGHGYIGYWAEDIEHERELGWLVFEDEEGPNEHEKLTDKELDRVKALWREGKKLPEGWFRLNRDACIKAWAEGVKRWGEKWYSEGNAHRYDYVIQMALLGEHRYA